MRLFVYAVMNSLTNGYVLPLIRKTPPFLNIRFIAAHVIPLDGLSRRSKKLLNIFQKRNNIQKTCISSFFGLKSLCSRGSFFVLRHVFVVWLVWLGGLKVCGKIVLSH